MGTYLDFSGNGSTSKDPASGFNGIPSVGSPLERAKHAVNALYGGDGATLTTSRSVDLDNVYGSAPHSSLGLQVAIAGRSTVVQSDVAAHLLEHSDPLRAVLGVGITDSHRVIVKRRFVMGGDAEISEFAAASFRFRRRPSNPLLYPSPGACARKDS